MRREAATSFRGMNSTTGIVRTGVPQGSKLSHSLFNYYIAGMPRAIPPVKRICYADDVTVWASGHKIPQLEYMINSYLRDAVIYLKENSLLISAPAIQLQGNNRVLRDRPPAIADEEQRLNRKQRCILSQLRSGHCHLLQDYKHRVFGESSDNCTDCGASPQNSRHSFTCNAHPTDLTHKDLWQTQWNRFVSSAISTTDTLNDLTTDLIMTNNNKMVHILVLIHYVKLYDRIFLFY